MQYSVSHYSFYKAIQKEDITAEACLSKAKELGFDAIEAVDFVTFPHRETDLLSQAAQWKEAAEKLGLPFSSLAVGADFLNGSDGNLEQEIQKIKTWVDVAVILGAPRMRHDVTAGYARNSGKYRSYQSLLPRLASACREVAEYAAQKGVATMTENHGFFSQDSQRVEALYNQVDHPNFGLLCDMGNFLCADEDPALAAARVAPYTRYVHAKDFIVKPFASPAPGEGSFQSRAGNYLRGTIVGHGNVPVKQCLHILKAAGFNGTIAIEFEGLEPPVDALRIGLANLKRYWAEL